MKKLIITTLLVFITLTQTTLTMERFSQAELEAEAVHIKTNAHKINMQRNIEAIKTIYTTEGDRLLHSADETSLKTNFLESQRLLKISIKLLEKYTPETSEKHQKIQFCKSNYEFLNTVGKIRGFISHEEEILS